MVDQQLRHRDLYHHLSVQSSTSHNMGHRAARWGGTCGAGSAAASCTAPDSLPFSAVPFFSAITCRAQVNAQTNASGPASSLLALVGTASAQRSYASHGLPTCLGLAGLVVTFTAYQVRAWQLPVVKPAHQERP